MIPTVYTIYTIGDFCVISEKTFLRNPLRQPDYVLFREKLMKKLLPLKVLLLTTRCLNSHPRCLNSHFWCFYSHPRCLNSHPRQIVGKIKLIIITQTYPWFYKIDDILYDTIWKYKLALGVIGKFNKFDKHKIHKTQFPQFLSPPHTR